MEATTTVVDKNIYFEADPEKQAAKLIEKDDLDQFELELSAKEWISHDTLRVTFKLPQEDWVMGLHVGGHLFFHFTVDGQLVTKRYTPVSQVNERGKIVFVIKVYKKTDEYPNGGKITPLIAELEIGTKVKMEGPKGLLAYKGFGSFEIKKTPTRKTKVGLIAGGTGITPCFQLVQASSLAQDGIPMTMIYSNKTKDDILAKDELDTLVKMNPENFKLYHTITRHDDTLHGEWNGLKGRISEELIKSCEGFPEPSEETLVCLCGPQAFNKSAIDALTAMGYTSDMIYKF